MFVQVPGPDALGHFTLLLDEEVAAEAMERFGSDKPDTRFAMELVDVADWVNVSGFGVFEKMIADGKRVINRKRQARIVAARAHGGARAQRIVEVRRMHLRAFVRCAGAQARERIGLDGPRVRQRAVAGAVLQADRAEAVVQRADVDHAREPTHCC